MGEVYRAEDTTLKRQVALKVLPPAVAGSQERLERFQREAETKTAAISMGSQSARPHVNAKAVN